MIEKLSFIALLILAGAFATPDVKAAASITGCRLKAGTVIQVPTDACEKEGGQVIGQPTTSSATQTADQLFATWEANNRTNHAEAAKAGKELLTTHPDDPRAPKVQAWVAAYEKVVAPVVVPKGSDTTVRGIPDRDNELIEEAKKYILNSLTLFHNEVFLKPQEKRLSFVSGVFYIGKPFMVLDQEFDGCVLRRTLYVPANNEYPIPEYIAKSAILFNKIDPSSIEPMQNQTHVIGMQYYTKYNAQMGESLLQMQYFKNAGTPNPPTVGEPIPSEVLYSRTKEIRIGQRDTLASFISARQEGGLRNGAFWVSSLDNAARLANAVREVVQHCGGKSSAF